MGSCEWEGWSIHTWTSLGVVLTILLLVVLLLNVVTKTSTFWTENLKSSTIFSIVLAISLLVLVTLATMFMVLSLPASPESPRSANMFYKLVLLVSQNLEPDFISYLAVLTSTARDKNNRPKTCSLPYFVSACQMRLHKEYAKFL